MKDTFEREITYLRISLTDLCNLRCAYCMPPEGVKKKPREQILSLEEIAGIAREAVLRDAGVDRVNISLDTLDPEKYRRITRGGCLEEALAGLQAARAAGLTPLKLNCVLIGGFNDDEIPALAALTEREPVEVRFIELMPIGDTAGFGPEAYLPCQTVLERLPRLEPVEGAGVAERFRLPGAAGTVGLIRPLSRCFCAQCDRIRLTADGRLKPCLHSREEISVRGLHGPALRRRLEQAILRKPARHGELSASVRSSSARDMNRIGG